MKRILIAILLCSGIWSCQVQNSYVRPVDSLQLFCYSSGLCGNYVTVPVELMELLLDFDDYLCKSQLDKEADTLFYGKIEEIYDNVYSFDDMSEIMIQCTIDTQGKSLREKGTVWLVASLYSWGYVDSDVLTGLYDYYLPEYTEIRAEDPDASEWVVAFDDMFETTLKYKGRTEGRDAWMVSSTGRAVAEKTGLVAVFTTGEAPLEVKERKMSDNERYLGNTYSGQFNVDIYDGETLKDFCHTTFRPGFTTKYDTNR